MRYNKLNAVIKYLGEWSIIFIYQPVTMFTSVDLTCLVETSQAFLQLKHKLLFKMFNLTVYSW